MRIAYSLSEVSLSACSCVTVGVFDGVHRGHQKLLTGMVDAARAAQCTTVVITFEPHPAAVLGHPAPLLLTSIEERAELMAPLGLDLLIVLTFTRELARTTVTDFIALLRQHLNLTQLWGGPDLALGHRREGDVPFLQRLGVESGFTVHIVEPLVWDGAIVNSSRVRAALQAGDVSQAAGCLGRPYRLPTTVKPAGRSGAGSTFVLTPLPGRLIPAQGQYECLVHIEGRAFTATAYICSELIEISLPYFETSHCGRIWALDFVARLGL